MANKFVGFLETVGKNFEKGLGFAVADAPTLEPLAIALFPELAPAAPIINSALTLLQNAAISVEQKFAALGTQTGTGVQKAADVLSIAGPAAVTLLTSAGVKNVDTSYVSKLLDLVVGILNLKAPATAPTT